jgi:hypothetical protein
MMSNCFGTVRLEGTKALIFGAAVVCTLRKAIQEASANNNGPTLDVINFNILAAQCNAQGVCTIPTTELPDIEDPVTIDGYTQSGATLNTLTFGTNAVLKIELSGASATPPESFNGIDGFDVEAGPTTIRGLVINGFRESTNGKGKHDNGYGNELRHRRYLGVLGRGGGNPGLLVGRTETFLHPAGTACRGLRTRFLNCRALARERKATASGVRILVWR